MMEHAALIIIILIGLALMGMVFLALFMPDDAGQARNQQRKQAHYHRWEDRL